MRKNAREREEISDRSRGVGSRVKVMTSSGEKRTADPENCKKDKLTRQVFINHLRPVLVLDEETEQGTGIILKNIRIWIRIGSCG